MGMSSGDFLLALIEKVTLFESLLYLLLGAKIDKGVAKDKVFGKTGNGTRDLHPVHYPLNRRSAASNL